MRGERDREESEPLGGEGGGERIRLSDGEWTSASPSRL